MHRYWIIEYRQTELIPHHCFDIRRKTWILKHVLFTIVIVYFGRLEAYSCKMITSDKKQWKKSQQNSSNAPQPLSPPEKLPWFPSNSSWTQNPRLRHFSEPGCSSLNISIEENGLVYADAISSRTLFELRSVMNASFQDYDFSSTKSEAFSLIPNFELPNRIYRRSVLWRLGNVVICILLP